jgi:hypothetical protein
MTYDGTVLVKENMQVYANSFLVAITTPFMGSLCPHFTLLRTGFWAFDHC